MGTHFPGQEHCSVHYKMVHLMQFPYLIILSSIYCSNCIYRIILNPFCLVFIIIFDSTILIFIWRPNSLISSLSVLIRRQKFVANNFIAENSSTTRKMKSLVICHQQFIANNSSPTILSTIIRRQKFLINNNSLVIIHFASNLLQLINGK